jgi:hypothetical protein
MLVFPSRENELRSMENDAFPKIAILLGFIAITVGIVSAYQNPATGYETSIYTATPLLFWIGSCFALLVSALAVFSSTGKQTSLIGGFLGGFSMLTIVSLPIIRGYYYMGAADALSHLGTTIDLNAGLLSMTESTYPAVHTLGSVLHDATGLPITQMLLLVIVVFIVSFLLFVPLAVRQLTGDVMTTYIGIFSGLLLLPLNHVSPSMHIHPTSQALMYAPVVLFTFFIFYRWLTWRLSVLFLVTAVSFILVHPQQAANLVAFFGVVAVVQIAIHIRQGDRLTRYDEWVLPEVLVYAGAFVIWAQNLEAFWGNLEAVYMIPFTETQAAGTTATRSLSLAVIGGSLWEIFLKLFFVSLLFALLTAVLMFSELLQDRIGLQPASTDKRATPDGGRSQPTLRYFFYGLGAVGVIFLVYLLGGISDQYFRHLGMLMVLASILGSITLGRILWRLSERRSLTVGRRAVATFLVICLVLSVPVVFPGPYFYDASKQVTEQQMNGYETTFEHQSDSILFENVRLGADRYGHAILGRDIPSEAYYARDEPNVPDHFANRNLPAFYEDPTYIPVTEADEKREAELWNGFRFNHGDFAYLDGDSEVDRVQTNGGYGLYLVN